MTIDQLTYIGILEFILSIKGKLLNRVLQLTDLNQMGLIGLITLQANRPKMFNYKIAGRG